MFNGLKKHNNNNKLRLLEIEFDMVQGIFYRLRKFATVLIPYSPKNDKSIDNFIITLLKFRVCIYTFLTCTLNLITKLFNIYIESC